MAAEVIKLKLENALANMILGERLLGKGDVARGVAELEMARKQAPESARTRWDLLRAYSSAGRGANANHEKEDIEKLNRLEFRHEL